MARLLLFSHTQHFCILDSCPITVYNWHTLIPQSKFGNFHQKCEIPKQQPPFPIAVHSMKPWKYKKEYTHRHLECRLDISSYSTRLWSKFLFNGVFINTCQNIWCHFSKYYLTSVIKNMEFLLRHPLSLARLSIRIYLRRSWIYDVGYPQAIADYGLKTRNSDMQMQFCNVDLRCEIAKSHVIEIDC